MSRMRGKDGRALRVIIFCIPVHGKSIFVERIKAGVAIPGFIKVQTVHAFTQKLLYPAGVVAKSIVSRICYNGMYWNRVYFSSYQRIARDGFFDSRFIQALWVNRTDNA